MSHVQIAFQCTIFNLSVYDLTFRRPNLYIFCLFRHFRIIYVFISNIIEDKQYTHTYFHWNKMNIFYEMHAFGLSLRFLKRKKNGILIVYYCYILLLYSEHQPPLFYSLHSILLSHWYKLKCIQFNVQCTIYCLEGHKGHIERHACIHTVFQLYNILHITTSVISPVGGFSFGRILPHSTNTINSALTAKSLALSFVYIVLLILLLLS